MEFNHILCNMVNGSRLITTDGTLAPKAPPAAHAAPLKSAAMETAGVPDLGAAKGAHHPPATAGESGAVPFNTGHPFQPAAVPLASSVWRHVVSAP
jgi:hypothetical protein